MKTLPRNSHALRVTMKISSRSEIIFQEDHILAVHDIHCRKLVLGMDEADLKELGVVVVETHS